MQPIIPDIDKLVKQVSDYMLKFLDEFQQKESSIHEDYNKGAAMIVFRLGLDYFATARDALHKDRVISGGALVRTSIENMANLFYIYDKPEKYPEAYVNSMQTYRDLLINVAVKDYDTLAHSRELKQANKWTKASIEDRMKASGKSLLNIYDILSYFGHPNPGSLTYLTNPKLKEAQLNLLKQANCLTALTLMAVVLNHSDIESVTLAELDVVARKLGLQLMPDGQEEKA